VGTRIVYLPPPPYVSLGHGPWLPLEFARVCFPPTPVAPDGGARYRTRTCRHVPRNFARPALFPQVKEFFFRHYTFDTYDLPIPRPRAAPVGRLFITWSVVSNARANVRPPDLKVPGQNGLFASPSVVLYVGQCSRSSTTSRGRAARTFPSVHADVKTLGTSYKARSILGIAVGDARRPFRRRFASAFGDRSRHDTWSSLAAPLSGHRALD